MHVSCLFLLSLVPLEWANIQIPGRPETPHMTRPSLVARRGTVLPYDTMNYGLPINIEVLETEAVARGGDQLRI